MTCTHLAAGQVLFREGDTADSVFRLVSGSVDILRELDGDRILLGTVGAGQFIGEMGVVEIRPRSATARAASEVEVEIFTPTEFLDHIASSPPAARELIQRLSQRLRDSRHGWRRTVYRGDGSCGKPPPQCDGTSRQRGGGRNLHADRVPRSYRKLAASRARVDSASQSAAARGRRSYRQR